MCQTTDVDGCTHTQGTTLPDGLRKPRRARPTQVEGKAGHRPTRPRRRMDKGCPRQRGRYCVRRHNHLRRHCIWGTLRSRRRRRRFGSCLRRTGIGGARARKGRRWRHMGETGAGSRARTARTHRTTCGYARSVWPRLKTVAIVRGQCLTSLPMPRRRTRPLTRTMFFCASVALSATMTQVRLCRLYEHRARHRSVNQPSKSPLGWTRSRGPVRLSQRRRTEWRWASNTQRRPGSERRCKGATKEFHKRRVAPHAAPISPY